MNIEKFDFSISNYNGLNLKFVNMNDIVLLNVVYISKFNNHNLR